MLCVLCFGWMLRMSCAFCVYCVVLSVLSCVCLCVLFCPLIYCLHDIVITTYVLLFKQQLI